MDWITAFIHFIDPFLIAPYRWFQNPIIGWFVGTFILTIWTVILGDITIAIGFRINLSYVKKVLEKTGYYHEQSIKAKSMGDEDSYKKINRLANEEFGRSFFLLMAMGMASLWPLFFAAAWLNERFGQITFLNLPGWMGGYRINFIGPLVCLYIIARFTISRIRGLFSKMLHQSNQADT